MSLPQPPSSLSSSVLDRVKLFLPVIKKANEDLDELIKKEGIDKVRIDNDLLSDDQATNKKIVVLDDNHDSDIIKNDNHDNDNDDDNNINGSGNSNGDNDNKMIQLEFALGNININIILILILT